MSKKKLFIKNNVNLCAEQDGRMEEGMKLKKLLALCIVVAMVVSTTACGSSSKGGSIGGDTEEGQTASENADAKVDQAKLSFILQEADYESVKSAVDIYTNEHPEVSVELTKVADFTALNQKVLAAHQANQDYDMMFVNHVDTLAFSRAGVLEPLNDYTQKDNINYSEILYPTLVEACTFEGIQYAVPVNTDTRVLAVNKDLFKQYGQQYPTTQEEMLKAAEAITKDDNYGFVNSMTRSAYVPEYEQGVFLKGNGASLYTIEGDKAVAQIDTPEMKNYLNFNLELLKYMPKDCLTMKEDDGRKVFASGKAAMYIFGPWEYTLLPELDFTYELINIPAGPKGSISTSGGYGLAIGSGSKNKDVTWSLLKYLTTDAEAAAKVASTGLPTMDAAFEVAPYTDSKYDAFREQLKNSELPEIPVANLNAVVEDFNKYWTDLLYGKITVDDACAQAQKSVQALLDKN